MKLLAKFAALLMLLALVGAVSPTWAQDATPEATAEATAETIVLVPHTDEAFGIESVVPDGWTDAGNGLFARATSASDTTLIAQQSAALGATSVMNAILPQLGLTAAPESVGTYQGAVLEWTLYQVDVNARGVTIKVDLALAESNGKTYIVLLQTSPDSYDELHAAVFLPILDTLAPLTVEATQEAVPYTVEEVTFANGDITLAGTLTLPPSGGPHAAIVLVTGSGTAGSG